MAEVGYFRGEGGKVWTMDLPLPLDIARQVQNDTLVRVNKDGTHYVEAPAEKPLTPKQQLQAEAEALGLAADGKADEIKARIDAKVAELREQATELEVDADNLSPVELLAAVDAKLAE